MDTEWFKRFGDIPGVTYKTPHGIDRRRLLAAKARPRELYLGGKRVAMQDEPDDSTSPAAQRWFDLNIADMSVDAMLRNLYETLEVPGEAEDYHFAIQDVIEVLWRRRRSEPLVLAHVESLSWLDVRLIQACPDAIMFGDELQYFSVPAFGRLITLYTREGAWRDALVVADIGEQFGVYPGRAAIVERVAALDAEAADA
ncbi:hypothetical protein [Rhodococcus sp. ARC_M6]|uniref:hypothetical protein n=1 Tax=Rhodococcus sp. ARC_M6 TaxID=2928852 RepID=UPI001FB3DA7F|nr:hypothetical protein [Rhodococcus sp. ARC_M6]MCJ0907044.1 hypothetical protein [Rhodococcus sp. ARC_M6]